MTRSTKQWQRNTLGLRSHAQKKAAATEQRAEAAIALLIREQRPINFKTVAETADISTAWLYGNTALKERIMHLRAQQTPKAQVKFPPKEQASSASKDAMIAALRQRIQKLEQENRDLKRQVEVAYGLIHQQGGGKRER
jgi:predicted RNase H-like nuclease (RuvC/YqgF family)